MPVLKQQHAHAAAMLACWLLRSADAVAKLATFIPCSIVLHFGVGARPFRDMPLYSKGRSTSVAARGRLA
jgi:hypothetical protein